MSDEKLPRPGCLSDNAVYEWYMSDRQKVIAYIEHIEEELQVSQFVVKMQDRLLDSIQAKLELMIQEYEQDELIR